MPEGSLCRRKTTYEWRKMGKGLNLRLLLLINNFFQQSDHTTFVRVCGPVKVRARKRAKPIMQTLPNGNDR